MGASYESTCYQTAADAEAAFCAGSYPRSRVDGSQHVSESCTTDGTTVSLVSTVAETGVSTTVAFPLTFATCDPSFEVDLLGALFLAALFGLIGIVLVRMTFWPLWQNQ